MSGGRHLAGAIVPINVQQDKQVVGGTERVGTSPHEGHGKGERQFSPAAIFGETVDPNGTIGPGSLVSEDLDPFAAVAAPAIQIFMWTLTDALPVYGAEDEVLMLTVGLYPLPVRRDTRPVDVAPCPLQRLVQSF